MAVEKQVNIKVTEKGLDEVNKDLVSLDRNLNKVDSEAKKTSKSIDEVAGNGGAIAILDSLTGGLATRMRDAYEATKLFNFSLKGTKTALLATGIGAIVVALGLIVAYWDDIVGYITGANKELERQIELNNKTLDNLDFELSLLEEKEKILKLEGKSTKEIRKQKEAVILLQQEENALLLENLKTQLEKEKSQANELSFWEKLGNLANKASGRGNITITGSVNEEEQTRLDEITQQIQDATLRTEKLKLALLQLNQPDSESSSDGERDEIKGVNSGLRAEGVVSPRLQAELDENTEIIAARYQLAADIIRTNELIAQDEAEQAEKRRKIEAALASYKIDTAYNVLNALSGLAEEGSAFAKAIAISQAVLSTYQGINKALAETTDFTPTQTLRFANAAAVGIAGFANVAKILSTDVSGRTKPNIGGGNGFGGQQAAPSFNVVGTSGVNQLAQTLNQDEQPLRAYVVSTEMSTRQALDRNIEETATIG